MASKGKSPQYYIPTITKTTSKQKPNSIKSTIINWLFQMSYEDRIKTFSLVNADICKTIIKMYEKYSSSSRLKFRINLKDKKPTVSQIDNSEDIFSSSDNYKFSQ